MVYLNKWLNQKVYLMLHKYNMILKKSFKSVKLNIVKLKNDKNAEFI